MKSLFSQQIIFLLIALMVFSFTIYWLGNKILKLNWLVKKHFRYGILVVSIAILSLDGGVISNIIKIVRIVNAPDVSFEAALADLDMDNYVPSNKVVSKKGKNIIVISLESYERGYLSNQMAAITPNLRSLKSQWNYYDMEQTPGSGWTSASLYTYLTGFPAFFQGNGNLVFKNSYDSKITSIGHVLKNAGYQMTYLVGNAEFAGTEDLLKAFQITNVIDYRKLKAKYETNKSWGIHDKDLFEEAKLELLKNSKKNKPFAIFMSTISTHNPNGVYDSRMEGLVKNQKSDIEFMAATIDYLISDFITFLENNDLLSNTTIYIFPDHLKMGDGSMFNNTGERGLFLLTNASKDDLGIKPKTNIYQIDLPKIILEGANVESNASFLTSYIEGDKNKIVRDKSALIASINSSGLKRKGFWVDDLSIRQNWLGDVDVLFGENKLNIRLRYY